MKKTEVTKNPNCNERKILKIERVYEKDAAKLLEIYAPYVKETAVSFECTVPSVEEFSERIRRISARYPYIKAVDNKGEILGYAYAGAFKSRCAYNWYEIFNFSSAFLQIQILIDVYIIHQIIFNFHNNCAT